MAYVLNKIECENSVGNTGICDCDLLPEFWSKYYFKDKAKVYTPAEIAVMAETLKASIIAPKTNRLFPSPKVETITDNSEDATTQTFGNGRPVIVREGLYSFTFQYVDGGLNVSNQIRTFNGKHNKYGIFLSDSKNRFYGIKKKDANGDMGLAPIPVNLIYGMPWRPNDGSNVASFRVMFSIDAVYLNEKIGFVQIDSDELILSDELNGLLDVSLAVSGSVTSTAFKIAATSLCGESIGKTYGDDLATADAWKILTAGGSPVTPSGVTYNETTDTYNFTVSSQTSGTILTVSLADPEDLFADVAIVGIESDSVAVTFP